MEEDIKILEEMIKESECFNYGIGSGCDEYCPVFQRKQCDFQEELEEKWKKR